MKFDIAQISDQGPRSQNEDATLAVEQESGALLAVADGLGGHFGGKVAADIAIECIKLTSVSGSLKESFVAAHNKILSAQHEDVSLRGMATTATAARIIGNKLIGAHCGDTRCVVQRGDGIRKLTTEQTEAQRLFEAGKLTKEELLTYPRRNILDSALGAEEEPRIDDFEFDLQPGDRVLITSDGVHERLRLRQLLSVVSQCRTAEEIVRSIKETVDSLGAEDNFSVVAVIVN